MNVRQTTSCHEPWRMLYVYSYRNLHELTHTTKVTCTLFAITVWLNPGKLVAPTWSGAHFSRSCSNHFWLQVGSLKGAGSACDENEIGTWIPLLTLNTHRGLQYGPFARL